jgi:hypothetical protein
MKVYAVTILEELDMNVPENDLRGVYTKREDAEKALVEWILDLMDNDEYLMDSLLRDENHKDIPGSLLSGDDEEEEKVPEEIDRKAISEYLLSEIKTSGGYYVWGNNNSYHFDIFERDLSDFA